VSMLDSILTSILLLFHFAFYYDILLKSRSSYQFQTLLQSSLLKTEVSNFSLVVFFTLTYFLILLDTCYLGSYSYRNRVFSSED